MEFLHYAIRVLDVVDYILDYDQIEIVILERQLFAAGGAVGDSRIAMLHQRRLAGEEPSEPGILLVIDQMARLAKMECFETLMTFLERCTEETRKANMTFIGGSTKWNARHFKGRADIRGCMNSALVHRCKPSQADLLLEDSRDRKLMQAVTGVG